MSRSSQRMPHSDKRLNRDDEIESEDSVPRYRIVRVVSLSGNRKPSSQISDQKHQYITRTVIPRSQIDDESHESWPRTVIARRELTERNRQSLPRKNLNPLTSRSIHRRQQSLSNSESSSSDDDSEIIRDRRKVVTSEPRYHRVSTKVQRLQNSSYEDGQSYAQPLRRRIVRALPTRRTGGKSLLNKRSDSYQLNDERQLTPTNARFEEKHATLGNHHVSTTNQNSIDYETDSDSSDSDSDSDESENSDVIKQSDKASRSTTVSGRLLLDYSKMLKSREEQRNYERERKKHEEEVHIVRLVQKEINKPPRNPKRKLSCGCLNPKHGEYSEVAVERVASEKRMNDRIDFNKNPTTPYNTVNGLKNHDTDAENTIKEKVRELEERRILSEKRSKVEVIGEREYLFRKEKEESEIKNRPSLQDLDVCKPPKIYPTKCINELDNIEVKVKYDDDFETMYPKPRPRGFQEVYYIDLTKPTEIIELKPFDVFERRIVPQPKKQHEGMVKVGGGWNTMNDYMERHIPVKKFVYHRNLPNDSSLANSKKEYYGFKSKYKYPK